MLCLMWCCVDCCCGCAKQNARKSFFFFVCGDKMQGARVVVLSVCLLVCLSFAAAENKLARGFGDNINWLTWEDGLAAAKKEGKPIMLLLHKSWCGACQNLKPKFAASADIQRLSANFIMVNAENEYVSPTSSIVLFFCSQLNINNKH